jgi:hypothetical protein
MDARNEELLGDMSYAKNFEPSSKTKVNKKKTKYVNKIIAILPIIYQKNKVQYFCNKFTMMISKIYNGEFVNWATIMYSQLVKKLIKWVKCQKT